MQIGFYLYLIIVVTWIPMGILIDYIAYKCKFPMQDALNPSPWALLGLVWPISLIPFLTYCLWYKHSRNKVE